MRLCSVELSNFKAFEHAAFELTPLTVLIGPNNAGKSTLLQALALLEQSAESRTLQTQGSSIDLGNDPIVLTHSSAKKPPSAWTIEVEWDDELPPEHSLPDARTVHVTFRLAASPETPVGDMQMTVTLDAPRGREVTATAGWPNIHSPQLVIPTLAGLPGADVQVGYMAHGPWTFTPSVQSPDDPQFVYPDLAAVQSGEHDATAHYAWAIASGYFRDFLQALQAFRYVGPDRAVEHSVFTLGDQALKNPRTAAQVVDSLAYNTEILRNVSDHCSRIFGYEVDVALIPGRQISLVARSPSGMQLNVVNLGSGFIQLIWIALQLELALKGIPATSRLVPTVGVEEPELHLHPGKQSAVAEMIADYVRQGTQIICTTQSEHFLMSLLQMVLAGTLPSEDLSVYYVDHGEARRLDVDENGRLSEGLRGFFEANEEQLGRHIELLLNRA